VKNDAADKGPWPPEDADLDFESSESTLTTTAGLMRKLLTVPKAEADEVHRQHQD
jgi:hypothetical protein